MSNLFKKEFDINKLLQEAKGCKKNYFLKEDLIAVLCSSLDLNTQISPSNKRQIIDKALSSTLSYKKPSLKHFESALRKEENDFLRKPKKKYMLATTLSIHKRPYFLPVKAIIDDCHINLGFRYPKKLKFTGISLQKHHQKLLDRTPLYTKIWVNTKARSCSEAVEKAMTNIDFLRGIWNLSINHLTYARISYKMAPINNILLGPVHTLHTSKGTPATRTYWYEPFFYEHIRTYNQKKKIINARKDEKRTRKELSNHKYQEVLKNALLRYCRALDFYNYETAFLKLWSILELLTDTVGQRYDTTIKRTSFLFANREFHKEVLEHLRFQRNLYVHHSEQSEEAEIILFQLKRYVEKILLFNIFSKYKFQNIQEFASFLSLPTKKDDLKSKEKKINYGLKFFKYKR